MTVALLLAGGTTAPDASNPIVAYGLLGVILIAFVTLIISGRLVPGREHDRVVAENDELRRQVPTAVAATTASTLALNEAAKAMRDMTVFVEASRRIWSAAPNGERLP